MFDSIIPGKRGHPVFQRRVQIHREWGEREREWGTRGESTYAGAPVHTPRKALPERQIAEQTDGRADADGVGYGSC